MQKYKHIDVQYTKYNPTTKYYNPHTDKAVHRMHFANVSFVADNVYILIKKTHRKRVVLAASTHIRMKKCTANVSFMAASTYILIKQTHRESVVHGYGL